MTHALSNRLASLIVNRGWIDKSDQMWCSYAIEKRIGKLLFLTAVLIWAALSHLIIEALVFVTVFCSYRNRMGGWHAKRAWICQLVSISLVIFSVGYLGMILLSIEPYIVLIANFLLLSCAFFLKPEYPVQVYFTKCEASENIRKKNWLLLIIFLLQTATRGIIDVDITVYSFIGLAFAVSSVIISKIKLKRGVRYESS